MSATYYKNYEIRGKNSLTAKRISNLCAIDINCNMGNRVFSNEYYRNKDTGLWNSTDEAFSNLTDEALIKQLKKEYDMFSRGWGDDSVFITCAEVKTKKINKMKGHRTTVPKLNFKKML